MKILLTGSAGYIAGVLLKKLLREPNVNEIVGIDFLPQPAEIKSGKLFWIKHNLAEHGWEETARKQGPFDVVVHLAFKIRSPYGKVEETGKENFLECKNVFDFAFENKIPKLIYSSSVAAYGASEENIGVFLKESSPLKENKSSYGAQKKAVEELLSTMISSNRPETEVIILRLGSVTGPAGQNLKSKSISLISFIRKILPFVIEADPAWARQFVHEEDVADAIVKLMNSPFKKSGNEIYNVAPPEFLTARDMAKLLGKTVIKVPKFLIRPLFWLAWNLTLGRIPTHPDSSAGLIYPINVDGSKIKSIGFDYRFSPADALLAKKSTP
ncbi:MAG: NAD-dependent epimerase/dehydratase family protein [Patescibacteria group bacterium]